MNFLEELLQEITPLDEIAMTQCEQKLNQLTKPIGSLGKLEEIVKQLSGIRGVVAPVSTKKAVYLFAGDHGIADEGVSAFPKAVTEQMVYNFIQGGAAINVLSRAFGAELHCVDVGVAADLSKESSIFHKKVRLGTRSFSEEKALTEEELQQAIFVGIEMSEHAEKNGYEIVIPGEMGIGNTATSSILFAVLTGQDVVGLTGHGTGVHGEALLHKQKVLQTAQQKHDIKATDVYGALQTFGGLEMCAMVGFMLGCAKRKIPVVLDGFIVSVAAYAAYRLQPLAAKYFIASHQSNEQAHKHVLATMELSPL
ncbi:MAG: nicotinate-nucleotide--dimethylbenzimidazole phosphoribosyltransferase, partial [Bacilli bacterium]